MIWWALRALLPLIPKTGAVLTTFLVVGCATAPRTPDIHEFPRSTGFPGSNFDQVWAATIDIFGEEGFPIDNLEKDSGLLVTDWMRVSAYYESGLDCGDPGKDDLSRANRFESPMVRFNVVVRQSGNEPTMAVNSFYRANLCNGQECRRWECSSTGLWERDLMNLVRARISEVSR
jgi:hypothetical protein